MAVGLHCAPARGKASGIKTLLKLDECFARATVESRATIRQGDDTASTPRSILDGRIGGNALVDDSPKFGGRKPVFR